MTTHVFIVDDRTFKYHLEYLFAGTGNNDYYIDFNGSNNTILHHAKENSLLGMIADFYRVSIGDFIIFYLQQSKEIGEGKFYGIFKVKSLTFLDNKDDNQFLYNELGKSLTFRCLIEPYKVYAEGVTEWEALDEIKNIFSPNQMLWSLIYRKLKGNRGNTMITMYESERLIKLIQDKNHLIHLHCDGFSFDLCSQKIISHNSKTYSGRMETINILPRLFEKYINNRQFETHLQAYILQNFITTNLFGILPNAYQIEWLGNEVSCGVGMQRIDIMASIRDNSNYNERIVIPIELKSCEAYPKILWQMQRYIDWLEQYYIPNHISHIQPMVICRQTNKNSNNFIEFTNSIKFFNANNKVLPLIYIEFKKLETRLCFEKVF